MMLKVDISKSFPGFSSHFSFSLDSQCCGLHRGLGSGKSTLVNMLAGLLRPDRGFICLNSKTLFDSEQKVNLSPDTRRIGVVFQHGYLFPHMNVETNLFYGIQRRPALYRPIDPEWLISLLRLGPLLKRRVTCLSGGEPQRVALGRTILSCPELILLDEPLNGLELMLKEQIIDYLQNVLHEFSIPMLFISHNLRGLEMMTTRFLVVDNGKIGEDH